MSVPGAFILWGPWDQTLAITEVNVPLSTQPLTHLLSVCLKGPQRKEHDYAVWIQPFESMYTFALKRFFEIGS